MVWKDSILDKEKLKQKFEHVYTNKIEPHLKTFDDERKVVLQKFINSTVLAAVIYIILYIATIFFPQVAKVGQPLILFFAIVTIVIIYSKTAGVFIKKAKSKLLTALLSIFGKFYILDKPILTLQEIKQYKLFPNTSEITNDDIIVGSYQTLEVGIQESKLTHESGSGKNRHTVTDFKGIFVKVKIPKNFQGTTVVRAERKGNSAPKGLEKVRLEDPEFEKIFNVYSDDQIEARYLLTTAFMERLKNVRHIFSQKTGNQEYLPDIYCVFDKGFLIIAISTSENFFEVANIFTTMIQREQYERVFYQLVSIFDLIYSLKLEQNIGM